MNKNNIKKLNPQIPCNLVQCLKVNSITELGLYSHVGHYTSHLYHCSSPSTIHLCLIHRPMYLLDLH